MERPAGTAARARLLALIAAVLLATIPLLPFYGNDQPIFSLGWPFRWTASYLMGEWASTAVIVVGVVLLTRSRRAMAAGVFLAVAIQTLTSDAKDVLAEHGIRRPWEPGVRDAMATGTGILLLLATTSLRAASPYADRSL